MLIPEIFEKLSNQTVLFITTKNLDYLRNTQEINLLRGHAAHVDVIGSKKSSYLFRLISVYRRLATTSFKRYNVVFIGFAPQLIIPFFSWKLKGKTVFEDFFISLYDTFVFDRKKISPKSLIAKLLYRLDYKTIHAADAIISDTRADSRYFSKTFNMDSKMLQVLYLEADTEYYKPQPLAEKRTDKFTVLYFGSILPLQGIEIILESARIMSDHDNIVFDIIGPVEKKLMKQYGSLPNTRFTDWLPQKDLADRIARSDLCLAGHFSSEIDKASRTIPGKAYIYRAMEKPMILGDNPANHELFQEKNSSIFYVQMGSAPKLKEKILFAMDQLGYKGGNK